MCCRILCLAVFLTTLAATLANATPLSGTKSIGPTGDYTSIGAAIADIQTQTLGGAVVLELQTTYISGVESFPLVFTNLTTTVTNTLTLRPQASATGLSISSANTTHATLDLDGAQFVTIDGRPGGVGTVKQLTIANTSNAGVALRFSNEASGNTVRHLTLQGVNANVSSGTVVFSTTTGANGNDNNTIANCDVRDGVSTPTNAIYAEGTGDTPAQYNSGNTISNCNVFNFYRSGTLDVAGVKVTGGNTGWTLSGNSFYQTASRAGANAVVRAIYLSDTDSSHTVTGNFIGGSAPNAGGTAWTTTGTTQPYRFVGIWLRVGTDNATSVQGNVIRNFAWNSSSNASTMPGVWSGIHVETGVANIGTVTGNTIGSGTGTGSISVISSVSGSTTFGIGSTSTNSVAISNNTIGSITTNGTTTGIGASITGIKLTEGTHTISSNTVGSTTTANSLNAASVASASAQNVTGIESAISGSLSNATITGNTVANLNNNFTGISISGQIRGIVTSAGVNTITGNTVRNLSTSTPSTNPSVVGIWQGSSSAGQTISGNVVHSLANTSNAAIEPDPNAAVKVTGIYFSGSISGANVIDRNFVHSLFLDSNSPSAELSGLRFESGGTFTAQNNMVRVGLDASGASTAGAAVVIGLYDDDNGASFPRNFIHNSVYVGGTATSGATNTFAYSSSSQYNSRDIRNNIFVNARSNSGGTGKHYAVTNGSVIAPPPGMTSDNNIIYVTGSGGVLGLFNGADYTTLAAWQAGTGLDASSATADPRFVNATGTSATVNLHLQASNPAEGRGVLVAAITGDFDGQTRGSLTPVDIGADAGNFTYDPPPAISYPLLSSGTTANRTLTGWATIVDNSGPVSGGANAPRLYYKKATDADAFVGNTSAANGWKYVTGTDSGGGLYSFTIDYSIIQGGLVTVGETIQYFVVAQDAANNLSSIPAIATASANPPVQNINVKPRTGVNSYSILAPLSGSVTVGSGGSYSSLSGAGGLFAALNASALTSHLTVNITGNTTEDGSVLLNATSANVFPNDFAVTIRPNSATMRTISGSGANGVIRLNGAQRVIIDGRFGGSGRFLTIRNTSTGSLASTLYFINDASSNTIRNCVIEGGGSAYGVVAFREGAVTGNDSNTVTENQIRDRTDVAGLASYLVTSAGSSDWIANSGNIISNNELFNFALSGVGVFSGSNSWSITGNTIYQTAARTSSLIGISLICLGTNLIRGNILRDLTTSNTAHGIVLAGQTGNTMVAGNRIWNLGNVSGSTSLARGIDLQPDAGQSVTVVNNMVVLGSSGTTAQSLTGVYDRGVIGSTTAIIYNTVLLTGSGGTFRDTRSYSYGGNSTATVKNNVFLNLRTGGSNHFAANFSTASTGTLEMDYNVYAGTGLTTTTNFFDASNGSSSSTPISYAQWKTNVPSDTHSSASTPGGNYTSAMFVAPGTADLHIIPGGNVLVNRAGFPVAGVTADFDGDTRSPTAPVIGADEILLPDIAVTQTSALTDGAGSVDFGTVTLGTSTAKTFTLTNPGSANLASLAITGGTSEFVVSVLSGTTIPVGSGSVTFTVTFTPSALGSRSATLHIASNVLGTKNPFEIALTGTGLTAQENWRQTWFGATVNSGNAADTFDFDRDGLVNLLEFGFGLNPTQNSAGQLPSGQLIGSNFVISFSQPAGVSGITYGAEWSTALTGTWNPITDTGTPPQHTFSVPTGSNTNLFVRLKVTGP